MHCSILTFAAVSVPYNPQSFEINAVIFGPSSLHTQGSNVITYGKGAKKESCNEERKKNLPRFICKNGDEREVSSCGDLFLDACIAQAFAE